MSATARPGKGAVLARFLVVAALVALDLWTKAAVFGWLDASPRPESLQRDAHGHLRFLLVGDWLALMTSRNAGVAFGHLDSFPYLIVIGRALAVLFLAWLVVRTPARQRLLVFALVLILAGALGNLHDNLFLDDPGYPFGRVRDFIDVYFPFWDAHFPTFNVADSCISVGAALLFLSSFAGRRSGEDPAAVASAKKAG